MTTSTLIAYHGNPQLKIDRLEQVSAHERADQIVQGVYWDKILRRGCAVGCTVHSRQHAAYETELGIPRALAHLEDRIFEGMTVERSRSWPREFLNAINPGADLSGVLPKFFTWLLTDPVDGVIKFAKTDESRLAIQAVSDAYLNNVVDIAEWKRLREQARSANAAANAARSNAFARQGDKLLELLREAK